VKLVLFDIDGTLLLSDGAGKRAVHRALADVFGSPGALEHRFDGKTDPQIVRELMSAAGHGDSLIDGRLSLALDRYSVLLAEELAAPGHDPHALPGVLDLLDALESRDDVILGLLTGNIVAGARAKLAAVGIDHERFSVGAYGSDHETRSELPALARDRLLASTGQSVSGEDIVIIGDTPADVQCGRKLGVRAIGVATGRYSIEELESSGARIAFADLSDTEAVLRAIFAPAPSPTRSQTRSPAKSPAKVAKRG
jgi:phosphoglycolate phosphatase-like HAD superfamily hydrolase